MHLKSQRQLIADLIARFSRNPDVGTHVTTLGISSATQNGKRSHHPLFSTQDRWLAGFTLLEMLVSMALLVLLVGLVWTIFNSASRSVKPSIQRMDSESQANMVFDRMANDFSKMVIRDDVDSIFYKNSASGSSAINDAMFFYSEAPAYYDSTNTTSTNKSNLALIGYRINPTNSVYTNTPVLERLGMGLTWDGNAAGGPGGPVFLNINPAAANPAIPDPATTLAGRWGGSAATPLGTFSGNYSDGSDPYTSTGDAGAYHVLSSLVFRMEIQFILSDGTFSVLPITNPTTTTNNLAASSPPTVTSDYSTGYTPGSRWYDVTAGKGYICTKATAGAAVWNLIGVKDISAVVVTLAILDSNTRKIVTGNINGAALLDAGSNSVANTWMTALNNPVNFAAASGIPVAAVDRVRIYQRTFYLANPGN